MIYYGKAYKTDKLNFGLDKKKLLSKAAKELHTNFDTDYLDYIILYPILKHPVRTA